MLLNKGSQNQREQEKPEKVPDIHPNLFSFFNQQYLSDCILIEPNGKEEFYSHRIVLATQSLFFHKIFQQNGSPNIKVTLPKPLLIDLKTWDSSVRIIEEKDQTSELLLKTCLSYFYVNGGISYLIEKGLTKANALNFYSQFHALSFSKGLKELEEFILEKVLNMSNCIGIIINFLRLKNEEGTRKIVKTLKQHFEEILGISDNFKQLLELPFELFLEILASEDLAVHNEDIILKLILSGIL